MRCCCSLLSNHPARELAVSMRKSVRMRMSFMLRQKVKWPARIATMKADHSGLLLMRYCQALHSAKYSQDEHCIPGDGTKSWRSSPSTYDSMSVNTRLSWCGLIGGSSVMTTF